MYFKKAYLEQLCHLDKCGSFDLTVRVTGPDVPGNSCQHVFYLGQFFGCLHVEAFVGKVRLQGVITSVGEAQDQVRELQHGVPLHLGQGEQVIKVEE